MDTAAVSTRMEIGLSKEDQGRIDALREVRLEKKAKRKSMAWFAKLNEFTISFTPIRLQDKVTFYTLLAVMINSGMPIIRSLYVLSEQSDNLRLGRIIRQLANKMEEGSTLSSAMDNYSSIFSESERGMIASGESSGNMNQILKNIAVQTEKGSAILKKVKGAMVYPAAIIAVVFLAIFLMLTMVVPQITGIFAETGQELPLTTRLLISGSDLARNSWLVLLVALGAAVVGLYLFSHSKQGRKSIHLGILYIPIFGKIIRKAMVARFARMLSSLLKAGIPIVKGLEINANAIGNEVYKQRIFYASQDVSQGIPLGENLSDSAWLFPPMVASMVLVGEKTANLVEISEKIADYYESEVDNAVASLSKLMEPLILVIMGVVVGFLVSAIMQPIIALSDVSSVL